MAEGSKVEVMDSSLDNRVVECPPELEDMVACGIESCDCHMLVERLRPRGVGGGFPYLDPKAVEEGYTHHRLRRQFEEVDYCYQLLVADTLRATIQKGVTPQELIEYLESKDGLRNDPKEYGKDHLTDKKQPLFLQLIPQLRKCTTIPEIFNVITPHFTTFTFHIITDIFHHFKEGIVDTNLSHRFVMKNSFYSRRPLAHCPNFLTHPRKNGFAFIAFHLNWDPNVDTLYLLETLRMNATAVFRLSHHAMIVIGYEMKAGVMIVYFQFPASMRHMVFPIDDQKGLFVEKRVFKVECCGQSEIIQYGQEDNLYDKLLRKTDYCWSVSEDNEFVTPPSTPPEPHPLPVVGPIGTTPPYVLDPTQAGLDSNLYQLAAPGFDKESYMAFVQERDDSLKLMAMLICNAVTDKPLNIIVMADTLKRAHTVHTELGRLLPGAQLLLNTGADTDKILGKSLNQDKAVVAVTTAAKLHQEMAMNRIPLLSIHLWLIDGCEGINRKENSCEDSVMYFMDCLTRRRYETFPQVVGISHQPIAGAFLLSERTTANHLMSMCGLLHAHYGLMVTDKFRSRLYSDDQHDVSVEATQLVLRSVKHDIPSLLCVEIGRLEQEMGVAYTLDRWGQEYRELIKALKLSLNEDQSNIRLIAICDLILLYSSTIDISKQKSPAQAKNFLDTNRPNFDAQNPALKDPISSLDLMISEYNSIMEMAIPFATSLARAVGNRFSDRPKTKGLCFIDYKQDPEEVLNVVSSLAPNSRGAVVPNDYFTFSKLPKNPDHIKIFEDFKRDHSRVLIAQFEIEKFVDFSFVDLPNCNFMARLQIQNNDLTLRLDEELAILTIVHTPQLKSVADLCRALQNRLLIRAIPKVPSKGAQLDREMDEIVRLTVRTHSRRRNELKRSRIRRSQYSRKIIYLHDISLRCRKCRIHVCYGNQLFSLFVDGCRNVIVPDDKFPGRFTVKKFKPIRKVPKQIDRLQKFYCANCLKEWGHICYFPKRGLELPCLRPKNFWFDARGDYKTYKMWPDVPFWIPPLGACIMNFETPE